MKSDSYKSIVKSTGIFGGVQVFTTLFGILKTKLIAVFLGAEGIGIYGLLLSTISMISSIANSGIKHSGVRDIALYTDIQDENLSKRITIIYRYSLTMGIIGMLITLILSRPLSVLLFKNTSYTVAFMFLAIVVLTDQLANAQLVVLQGLRQLSFLAKANLIGSFLGLIVAVPVFYFRGMQGIVPVILLSSILLLLRALYYVRKLPVKRVSISWKESYRQGFPMIKLGASLSFSLILGMGSLYFLRVFIGRESGMEHLGFYNASVTVVDTYVGMIFTAMSTDYFPRLSTIHKDKIASARLINEQSEMGVIGIVPLIQWMITFSCLCVLILYSTDFIPMISLLRLLLCGVLFKAVVYAFDYYLIAQGKSKIFIVNEILSWSYIVLGAVAGYSLLGFEGIGWGYLGGYFLSLLQSITVNILFFRVMPGRKLIRLLSISCLLIGINLWISYRYTGSTFYILSVSISLISTIWAVFELNSRISVTLILSTLIQKIKGK